MSYGVIVQIPTDVIDAISETAQSSPKLMGVAYKRAMSRLRSRWLAELRKEPPSAKGAYPLPWMSDNQRIAVIIKLRKEGNLPYQRTHELSQGWDVQIVTFDNGGGITVSNPAPEAEFVVGDRRQPMFEKIGWLDPVDVNNEFLDEATDVLIDTWYTISDPFGGAQG